jgi:SAM-dependent methyltransferase
MARTSHGLGDVDALLERFLGERSQRTARAYAMDLQSFADFSGLEVPAALARLLGGGPDAAGRLLMDYAIDLLGRSLSRATVDRRLSTLRAFSREAATAGMVDWALSVPTWDEITTAMRERSITDSEHYLLPRHPDEIDRLDVQHYAFKAVLRANHAAPVPREAAMVLDVGAGSGQWAFDACDDFPDATVVGLDLMASKPAQPPRYRFVRANVLNGLPFGDGTFDYVHQRLMVSGIPLAAWPAVVADLARVTRPGGWVELVEGPWAFDREGPATRELLNLVTEMLAARGLDTTTVVFDSLDGYLRDAGLQDVTRRQIWLPIGEWGGQVGSLMATDLRAGLTRMAELLRAQSRLTAEDARRLIQEALEECERNRTTGPSAIAYGRKAL